ncbi:MAG: hypothetical protein V4617_15915 [Gemmatimonadota bacterium]
MAVATQMQRVALTFALSAAALAACHRDEMTRDSEPRAIAFVHPFFAGHWRGSLDSGGTWLLMLDSGGGRAKSIRTRPHQDPSRVDSAITEFDGWLIDGGDDADSSAAILWLMRRGGRAEQHVTWGIDSVTISVSQVLLTRLTRRMDGIAGEAAR